MSGPGAGGRARANHRQSKPRRINKDPSGSQTPHRAQEGRGTRLADGEAGAAPESELSRRPAGRTDAHRLTKVRINQPTTPRRLNEVRALGLVGKRNRLRHAA